MAFSYCVPCMRTSSSPLVGCIPSSVGDMSLSNEESALATFDVELTFQYFELEEATGTFNEIR